MKLRSILTLITCILNPLLYTGCAPDSHPQGNSQSWQRLFDSWQTVQEKLDRAEVYCTDKKACPEQIAKSVGLLNSAFEVTEGLYSLSDCTAWVISAGERPVMASNRHCLPPDLINDNNKPCGSRMGVTFLDGSRWRCSRIISHSQLSTTEWNRQLDYAFFEIESHQAQSRLALTTSTAGFVAGQLYTLAVIHPIAGGSIPAGTLQTLHCPAVEKTVLVPQFSHPFSPIVTLGDCPVRVGNSGSPVMDAEGKVRGLLYAVSLPHSIHQYLHKYSEEISVFLSKLALVTNLACVPESWIYPQSQTMQIPSYCQVDLSQAWTDLLITQDLQESAKEKLIKNLEIAVEKWHQRQEGRNAFRWRAREFAGINNDQILIALLPDCVLSKSLKKIKWSQGSNDESQFFALQIPTWKAQRKIDRLQRITYQISLFQENPHLIEMRENGHQFKITQWTGAIDGRHSQVIFEGELPSCD